jgi:hypothetical protein
MKIIYKNQFVTLFFSSLFFFFSSSVSAEWFGGDDEDILWKTSLNQYIKYAEQDSPKFGKNEHPVELNEKELVFALKSLEYEDKGLLSLTETTETIFTTLQIKVLSQNLSRGLKNAKSDQDVIFVLEKAKDKLFGLKERSFLAGRAFYKDGKLNLIIGDYEYFRSAAFEKAYDPGGQSGVPYTFNFGKRTKKSRAFENTHVTATGVENKQLGNVRRRDWIVIDVKIAADAYVNREKERKNPTTKIDKQLEVEAAKLAKQRREMRIEMARMRKKVDAVSKNGASSTRSIEERMATLDELLGKKLITQEEYDSKRKEIINDI